MSRTSRVFAFTVLAVTLAASSFAQGTKAKAQGTKPKPGTYARFDTTMGSFTVRLWPDKAPQTVANFVGLAEGTLDTFTGKPAKGKPYYNGSPFHRIVSGFMIQGGGVVRSDGSIGSPAYTIADEFDPKFKFNRAGILAMANATAPHSARSQFFITVAPYASLNGKYTPFGEVVSGLDVVKKISTVKTTGKKGTPPDQPLEPVVIKSVTIERVQ